MGFAQQGNQIPFQVRRIFYLHDIAPGPTRGGHAHLARHQFLIMMAGGCTVTVDDGTTRTPIRLFLGAEALYLPPLLWLDLGEFTEDAVCCVLTSDLYDEAGRPRHPDRRRLALAPGAAVARKCAQSKPMTARAPRGRLHQAARSAQTARTVSQF